MKKPLVQVKTDLSKEYLGKQGIHGIGYQDSQKTIVVYVEKNENEDRTALHEQLKNQAAPYSVILIEEDPPMVG
ncbi:MAG: hypothetical protein ABL999_16925 [Pyrinomonadaceae bacterium]